MKENIHPQWFEASITCICGNAFQTYSTKKALRVEVCSQCHPFYTGKQRTLAKKGQVEKFQQRYSKSTVEAQ